MPNLPRPVITFNHLSILRALCNPKSEESIILELACMNRVEVTILRNEWSNVLKFMKQYFEDHQNPLTPEWLKNLKNKVLPIQFVQ